MLFKIRLQDKKSQNLKVHNIKEYRQCNEIIIFSLSENP